MDVAWLTSKCQKKKTFLEVLDKESKTKKNKMSHYPEIYIWQEKSNNFKKQSLCCTVSEPEGLIVDSLSPGHILNAVLQLRFGAANAQNRIKSTHEGNTRENINDGIFHPLSLKII